MQPYLQHWLAQIVDGILHQGCKLVLGGMSKSNKSWCPI